MKVCSVEGRHSKIPQSEILASSCLCYTRVRCLSPCPSSGHCPRTVSLSGCHNMPPTILMLCGKAYRPSHSTRRNRQLSAATQRFQTTCTSSTPVLTGSTVLCCCGAPSPSPSLLADSSSHCRTSRHRTHLCLWSSAVASSSSVLRRSMHVNVFVKL